MKHWSLWIAAWLVTVVCSVGIVTIEFDLCWMVLLLWSGLLWAFLRFVRRTRSDSSARWVRAVHLLTFALIYVAAELAPVKLCDRVQDRVVTLPEGEMSLRDLEFYLQDHRREWPLQVYVPDGPRAEQVTVRFTSSSMTLRQFIQELETASGLNGRFGGCGNATTVLWGTPYNLGLFFSPKYGDRKGWYDWDSN
jgi:hypothetical protein